MKLARDQQSPTIVFPAAVRPRFRRTARVVGAALLTLGGVGVGAHYASVVSTPPVVIAAVVPILALSSIVAVPLLLLARWWIPGVLAVVVASAAVWTQWPLYQTQHGTLPPHASLVRLMQSNLFLGDADLAALVAQVRAQRVDVLTVIELTPSAAHGLAQAGLGAELPHSYLRAREGGGGAGIYSRYPLSDGAPLPGFVMNNVRATMHAPGVGDVVVYALHMQPPFPHPVDVWAAELEQLNAQLRQDVSGPTLIGADMNATYDHSRFRALLDPSRPEESAGLIDAGRFVGAGVVPTFPSRLPIIAIDHILVRDAVPTSFWRMPLAGSDHFAVLADIALGTSRSG